MQRVDSAIPWILEAAAPMGGGPAHRERRAPLSPYRHPELLPRLAAILFQIDTAQFRDLLVVDRTDLRKSADFDAAPSFAAVRRQPDQRSLCVIKRRRCCIRSLLRLYVRSI